MRFLSMFIFIALAVTLFTLMVLRPPVEGNAINLGVPSSIKPQNTSLAIKEVGSKVEETVPQESEAKSSEDIEAIKNPITESEEDLNSEVLSK